MSLPSMISLQTAKQMIRDGDRFELYVARADCFIEITRISALTLIHGAEERGRVEMMCYLHTEDNGNKTIRLG